MRQKVRKGLVDVGILVGMKPAAKKNKLLFQRLSSISRLRPGEPPHIQEYLPHLSFVKAGSGLFAAQEARQ
jgi:hypothetical protein